MRKPRWVNETNFVHLLGWVALGVFATRPVFRRLSWADIGALVGPFFLVFWFLNLELRRTKKIARLLKEIKADRSKSQSSGISYALHKISQPAFALRVGWNHIATLLLRQVEHNNPVDLQESLSRLVPIVTASLESLNLEIESCRKKISHASIKTRLIEFSEIMSISGQVRDYCASLGVKLDYYTRSDTEQGRRAIRALSTTIFGDLDQLREVVLTMATFVAAQVPPDNLKKRVSLLLDADVDAVTLRIFYQGFSVSQLECEADTSIAHVLRIHRNYGGTVKVVDGFALGFPLKTHSKIERLKPGR